jgi:hypothetical protein
MTDLILPPSRSFARNARSSRFILATKNFTVWLRPFDFRIVPPMCGSGPKPR